MDKEMMPTGQLIRALLEAARRKDWGTIDDDLVPQLDKVDGNQAAGSLLGHVQDDDPNIRDVVATALCPLKVSNEEIKEKVLEAMVDMAIKDPEKYPAGRAAMVLHKYREEEEHEHQIADALDIFRRRVQEEGWTQDLKENIPEIDQILWATIDET